MAIKQIITVPSELPHAHLYLDDVEEIQGILLQALLDEREEREYRDIPREALTKSFQMKGHSFDSIEDLKEFGGSATEFVIKVSDRYGDCELQFLTLSNPRASIYHLSEDRGFATYAKLKAVMDRRTLRLRNVVAQMPDWTAMVLPTVLIYVAIACTQLAHSHRAIAAVLSFGTFALLMYFGARPTRIYFVQSHERSRSRGQKMKDYIERIVFLVAGTLIGIVLTKLLSR